MRVTRECGMRVEERVCDMRVTRECGMRVWREYV